MPLQVVHVSFGGSFVTQPTCPLCQVSFAILAQHSVPYRIGSRREALSRDIVFCPRCNLGIVELPYGDHEINDLYQSGEYWADIAVDPRPQTFAMPYALAQARWDWIKKRAALPASSLRILDVGAGLGCFGMVAVRDRYHTLTLNTR